MNFRKRKLADADMGYGVSVNRINGAKLNLIASEGQGPAFMIDGDTFAPVVFSKEPDLAAKTAWPSACFVMKKLNIFETSSVC